jgi:uncharacterized protein (DUF885 family)
MVMEAVRGRSSGRSWTSPEESPFYARVQESSPLRIAEPERARLVTAASTAIRESVVPAYRRFAEVFEKEYLPACTSKSAHGSGRMGRRLTPSPRGNSRPRRWSRDAIQKSGCARSSGSAVRMDRVMAQVGWKGTRREFFDHLRSDERFYLKTPERTPRGLPRHRETHRSVLREIIPHASRLPYGVEPIPEKVAPNTTAAYYRQPPPTVHALAPTS